MVEILHIPGHHNIGIGASQGLQSILLGGVQGAVAVVCCVDHILKGICHGLTAQLGAICQNHITESIDRCLGVDGILLIGIFLGQNILQPQGHGVVQVGLAELTVTVTLQPHLKANAFYLFGRNRAGELGLIANGGFCGVDGEMGNVHLISPEGNTAFCRKCAIALRGLDFTGAGEDTQSLATVRGRVKAGETAADTGQLVTVQIQQDIAGDLQFDFQIPVQTDHAAGFIILDSVCQGAFCTCHTVGDHLGYLGIAAVDLATTDIDCGAATGADITAAFLGSSVEDRAAVYIQNTPMSNLDITTLFGGAAAKIIAIINTHHRSVIDIIFCGIVASFKGSVLGDIKQTATGTCHRTGLGGVITAVKIYRRIGIGIENTAGG